jgi:hypothetical protein
MLQWLYTYVAVTIHICCKHMFQMFQLLQTYVAESDFMVQVFHEQAQAVPAGECRPCVCNTNVAKVDLDVAYVTMAIHICCKYLFIMFHLL